MSCGMIVLDHLQHRSHTTYKLICKLHTIPYDASSAHTSIEVYFECNCTIKLIIGPHNQVIEDF